MSTKWANIVMLLIVTVMAVGSSLTYPKLPAVIPVHWGIDSHPNGMATKSSTAATLALILLIFPLLLNVLPRLTARRYPPATYTPEFNIVMVTGAAFVCAIAGLLFTYPLYPALPMMKLVVYAILVLFLIIGKTFKTLKRNPWCGIRTRATLSSDSIWEESHKYASNFIVLAATIGLVTVGLGAPPWVGLLPLILPLSAATLHASKLAKQSRSSHLR